MVADPNQIAGRPVGTRSHSPTSWAARWRANQYCRRSIDGRRAGRPSPLVEDWMTPTLPAESCWQLPFISDARFA
jgi:hypothetical protein